MPKRSDARGSAGGAASDGSANTTTSPFLPLPSGLIRRVHQAPDYQRVLSSRDGESLGRRGPAVPSHLQPLYLNILVAGDSGLGKSTFIANTAARLGVPAEELQLPEGGQDPSPDGGLRTVLPDLELPEAQRTLRVSFLEAPGYSETMDVGTHLQALVSCLLAQRARDYTLANGVTELVRSSLGMLPHSTSVCVYFIQPHRIKPVDLEYLSALSKLVPVVPVIAKADCHTMEELEAHRQDIIKSMEEFQDAEGNPDPIRCFTFSPAAMSKLGLTSGDDTEDQDPDRLRVFSLICSRDTEEVVAEDGAVVPVPVRSYGWGSISSVERAASDTILLQRLLTEDVWTLMADVKDRYLDFCTTYEAARCNFERLVAQHVAPHAAFLEGSAAAGRRKAAEEALRDTSACLVALFAAFVVLVVWHLVWVGARC